MKKKFQTRLRACLAFLMSLLALSCSKSGGRLGNDYGIAYLPLRDGQKLVYQRRCDGQAESIVMELSLVRGDLETPEFRVTASDTGDMFLRRQGNAVVCLMENPPTRLKELGDGELYLSTWLLDGATPGTFWEDEDTGLRTAVAGFESITTPAGAFPNCMKVTIEATEILWEVAEERLRREKRSPEEEDAVCEGLSYVCVRWFARGVGLVKEEHGACRMELVSYR